MYLFIYFNFKFYWLCLVLYNEIITVSRVSFLFNDTFYTFLNSYIGVWYMAMTRWPQWITERNLAAHTTGLLSAIWTSLKSSPDFRDPN